MELRSYLTLDLDRTAERLSIKITTRKVHTRPEFIIKSSITVLDATATPALWHEFPDRQVSNQELGLEYSLSLDLPRLPDQDFDVGAWLMFYGLAPFTGFEPVRLRIHSGVGVAFRWHHGDLVSAYGFEGLDDAVLEADFAAGRVDRAAYRRRHLEIHRARPFVDRTADRIIPASSDDSADGATSRQ